MTVAGEFGPSEIKIIDLDIAEEGGGWDDLRAVCPFLTNWGVNVLRSGLEPHAKTVVVETDYICKDYRDLYSNYYSKKFASRPSRCARIHFFAKAGIGPDDVIYRSEALKDDYIGYAVIVPTLNGKTGRCIGRTVIDPLKCLKDGYSAANFHCLRTLYRVRIQGAQYSVQGFPYMSQSTEATVCAHTALWTICRYFSERYPQYAEKHPYDLIKLTGDTMGRKVPYRGMTYEDYSTILTNFGCHPVLLRPKTFGYADDEGWFDDLATYHDIYSYVESGFPTLMSFRKHVAVAVGHTSRSTLAYNKPDENGFHDSYALLDQYVMVDDNYFPFQLLGDRQDARNYGKSWESQLKPFPNKQDIYAAVIPLAEKAFMEPGTARKIGQKFFARRDIRQLVEQAGTELGFDKNEPLITRLLLTSANAFKKRKHAAAVEKIGHPPDPQNLFPLGLNLPHFVWIMELSPLNLYNQGLSVGEIVIDASDDVDAERFIYARVVKRFYFGTKADEIGTASSFRQYTHNLGEW